MYKVLYSKDQNEYWYETNNEYLKNTLNPESNNDVQVIAEAKSVDDAKKYIEDHKVNIHKD